MEWAAGGRNSEILHRWSEEEGEVLVFRFDALDGGYL